MIKRFAILSVVAAGILVACQKNKFETKPQVKIKSISPAEVSQGDVITMKGQVTDKEGDLDSIYIVYKWYDGTTAVKHDTLRYGLDYFGIVSGLKDGEINVHFGYGVLGSYPILPASPVNLRDTSATLGLIILDKQKNRSEYAESAKIRLKKT